MMNEELMNKKIDPSKFEFVQTNEVIHDQKLDTKPIGYFKDAFNRFKKNKSSVTAFLIIILLLLFALLGPLVSSHKTTDVDGYYTLVLPKSTLFSWAGWDGCKVQSESQAGKDLYRSIFYEELNDDVNNVDAKALIKEKGSTTDEIGNVTYDLYIDSYMKVGYVYISLEAKEYFALQAYQNANNIQIIYPISKNYYSNTNANVWYQTTDYAKAVYFQNKTNNSEVFRTEAVYDANGEYIPIYRGSTNLHKADYYSLRLKNDDGTYTYTEDKAAYSKTAGYVLQSPKSTIENCYYQYAVQNQTGYYVRVLYYEYYKYSKTTINYNGNFTEDYNAATSLELGDERNAAMENILSNYEVSDDGYYCKYIFGSNNKGKDIFVMLSSGARLSFILAIFVSAINLTIGAIYGAIEGYFGGTVDLVMERISDILNEVPFIVVATLFNLYLADKVGAFVSLLFAFVMTGWIGMAARTRMQFYRFKGQEYVLSARTLGAKDTRIMFKHIFPNAIGTIITGSILSIPGVIFSESSLSYLHIVDLETSGFTSVGTLLSNGTSYVSTYPHVVLTPALFIALLMISFNLFGNGLRDAFNPSLRGVDE